MRRRINGFIDELPNGAHLVTVMGVDGTWYAVSRTSEVAFGLAGSAASFGESPRGEWRVGEPGPAPWAVGVYSQQVIAEFERHERTWTLAIRGVDPAMAEALTDTETLTGRALTTDEAAEMLRSIGWDPHYGPDARAINTAVREYARLTPRAAA